MCSYVLLKKFEQKKKLNTAKKCRCDKLMYVKRVISKPFIFVTSTAVDRNVHFLPDFGGNLITFCATVGGKSG